MAAVETASGSRREPDDNKKGLGRGEELAVKRMVDWILPFLICMKIKQNLVLHMPSKLHFIPCLMVSHTAKKVKNS